MHSHAGAHAPAPSRSSTSWTRCRRPTSALRCRPQQLLLLLEVPPLPMAGRRKMSRANDVTYLFFFSLYDWEKIHYINCIIYVHQNSLLAYLEGCLATTTTSKQSVRSRWTSLATTTTSKQSVQSLSATSSPTRALVRRRTPRRARPRSPSMSFSPTRRARTTFRSTRSRRAPSRRSGAHGGGRTPQTSSYPTIAPRLKRTTKQSRRTSPRTLRSTRGRARSRRGPILRPTRFISRQAVRGARRSGWSHGSRTATVPSAARGSPTPARRARCSWPAP